MLDAVPDDSARRCCRRSASPRPSKAFPTLQDALQIPTLNIRGLASVLRRCRRAHDHSRSRDRGDRHPAGQGDARPTSSRSSAPHIAKQGYHSSTANPTTRRGRSTRKLARDRASDRRPSAFRTSPLGSAGARASSTAITQTLRRSRPCSCGRSAARCRSRRSSTRSGFPAMLVPTVNFDNNQHEENENLRLGTSSSIVTIAAVLRCERPCQATTQR